MNKLFFVVLCFLLVIGSSCSNKENNLFQTKLKAKDDLKTITYRPNMEFVQMSDSLDILLEPNDFSKMLGGPVKLGDYILKTDKFSMRVILVENYAHLNAEYQIILRTYSKDLKIIDNYMIANTTGKVACEGYITKDLKIFKFCEDDSEFIAEVNEYGEFIKKD